MNLEMAIAALLQGAGFFVAGPLGIVVLTLGILGRRRLTRGRCAACRAELPRDRLLARDRCPSCNAELAEPSAIRPVRAGTGWKRIIGGVVILLLAVGAVAGGIELRNRATAVMFGAFGTNAPTPTLVSSAYSKASPFTFEADEIARRMGQGRVTAAELRAELATLLARGTTGRAIGGDRLLALSMADGVVDPALATALLMSPSLAPVIDQSSLSLDPRRIFVRQPSRQRSPDDPVDVVYLVREVRANGVPLANVAPFGVSAWQTTPILLPVDATTIEIDVDLLLMSAFDAQRVAAPSGAMRAPESWPTPLATSRLTLPLAVPPP